jgi:hypothetical protein
LNKEGTLLPRETTDIRMEIEKNVHLGFLHQALCNGPQDLGKPKISFEFEKKLVSFLLKLLDFLCGSVGAFMKLTSPELYLVQ